MGNHVDRLTMTKFEQSIRFAATRQVARAICKSRTCEGFNCCEWPANSGRTRCPVEDGGYDDAAEAAIEAVRELDH